MITTKNLPSLDVTPTIRYYNSGSIRTVSYKIPKDCTYKSRDIIIFISFKENGLLNSITFNGISIPKNSEIKIKNGKLCISIP